MNLPNLSGAYTEVINAPADKKSLGFFFKKSTLISKSLALAWEPTEPTASETFIWRKASWILSNCHPIVGQKNFGFLFFPLRKEKNLKHKLFNFFIYSLVISYMKTMGLDHICSPHLPIPHWNFCPFHPHPPPHTMFSCFNYWIQSMLLLPAWIEDTSPVS